LHRWRPPRRPAVRATSACSAARFPSGADVGVVAMITREDAEAFWVVHIDTTLGKILVSK
jgi:hypothetical protein